MNWTERRARMRAILEGDACIYPASVFDPMSARLAQSIGFEAGMFAGSVASLTVLGAPDFILLTLTEFAEQALRINRAASLPVLADADHGYGNALNVMRTFGRIAVCGMIDQYNATTLPQGPGNIVQVIPKRIAMRGFVVSDHYDMLPAFMTDMTQWIGEGRIKWRETVYDGIENAVDAFVGLFHGDNLGKAVVRLGPDRG